MKSTFDELTWFWNGDIWTPTSPARLGGPQCAAEIPYGIKIPVNILSIIWHCYMIYRFKPRFMKRIASYENEMNSRPRDPSFLEKMIGNIGFLSLAINCVYKALTGRLVYMFNPCHIVLLLCSYCLTTKRTKSTIQVCNVLLSNMAAAVCGMIFMDATGLDFPYEVEIFYVEHLVPLLCVPLLFLGGRYQASWFNDPSVGVLGFAHFALYQRAVLWSVSELSLANLNYAMCHIDTDPFYPLCGHFYLVAAEFYLILCSFMTRYFYLTVGGICGYFRSIGTEKHKMKDLLASSMFYGGDVGTPTPAPLRTLGESQRKTK